MCYDILTYARQLADFFRFGVKYVEDLYSQQPIKNAAGVWKYASLYASNIVEVDAVH